MNPGTMRANSHPRFDLSLKFDCSLCVFTTDIYLVFRGKSHLKLAMMCCIVLYKILKMAYDTGA
jgi:hypothetical protein